MEGMLQLLRLLNALEEVAGRKKLQKIVYILQSKGYDFPQEFGYLHYGPYSSDVAAEINALCTSELVSEQPGAARKPYRYSLTPGGKTLLTRIPTEGQPGWVALARKLNKKSSDHLEAVSTILYLQENGYNGDLLDKRFAALKPQLVGHYQVAKSYAQSLTV